MVCGVEGRIVFCWWGFFVGIGIFVGDCVDLVWLVIFGLMVVICFVGLVGVCWDVGMVLVEIGFGFLIMWILVCFFVGVVVFVVWWIGVDVVGVVGGSGVLSVVDWIGELVIMWVLEVIGSGELYWVLFWVGGSGWFIGFERLDCGGRLFVEVILVFGVGIWFVLLFWIDLVLMLLVEW